LAPSPTHSLRAVSSGQANFIGKRPVNLALKTLLPVLLAASVAGLGQQAPSLDSLLADAQTAQASGNYAAAAADYTQALRLSPHVPELWANLGLMQQETGDFAAATLSFQEANRLNPSLYVPNLFLGIDYAHAGKAKEAIPLLMKAERLNRNDPQAPLALGRAYIAASRFPAAARELGHAIALNPKLGSAWFTLGIARLDQVEDEARTMSVEDKQSPFAGALYAESLARQARYGEAASLYKSLLNAHPQLPCIRAELGFTLLQGHDRQGAAEAFAAERAAHPECGLALLGQARLDLESGNNAHGVETLRELWNRDHGFFESNASLLTAAMPREKAAAMASFFASEPAAVVPDDLRGAVLAALDNSLGGSLGVAASTPDAEAAHRTAEQDYADGRFGQCARRLDSEAAPLSADKLRLLAACAFLTGDNQRASGAADALLALEPRSLEALYWSIQANERLAFRALARFQELEPDSARSHILLGDIYSQLERYADAQAEYEKALAMAPGDEAGMLGLAMAYLNNNNVKAGMETARTALERNPNDPELNLAMAQALIAQRAYADAEPYLIKSLHAKPQMLPRIHALLGKAYAETGRTQDAITQLKLGESSDENGSVQYLLSRLYRKLGDMPDASAALERMKTIKEQRAARGYKRVEDPDLSPLEPGARRASAP
jgi:tetratricopeptide (TPR) repeat protein